MPAHETLGLTDRQPFGRGPRSRMILLALAVAAMFAFVALLSVVMNIYSLEMALATGFCIAFSILCFGRVKWVVYILIFACLFSPEFQVGGVLGRAAKRPPTIRVEDILLVVIVLTWLIRTAVDKEIGLMLRTTLNKPIFLYALVCIIATAAGIGYGWVDNRLGATLFVLKYIQYFVLFFMIVNHMETPRDVRNVVIAGILTYIAVCVYGYLQIPGGDRPSTFAEAQGEPNTLAGYLVFMIGICSGLLLAAPTILKRLFWGLLALAGVILLAYTLSRSGWLGLAGVVLVLMTLGRHRYAVLAACLVTAGLIIMFSSQATRLLPASVEQRGRETFGEFEEIPWQPPVVVLGLRLDPSASERYRSYEKSLTTWFSRASDNVVPFFTGSGVLGGGGFVDGQYVRTLAETGILGLAAFIVLLVAIWRDVWRSYRQLRTPWYKGLALGYLAGFAGLLLHALGANTFIIVRIMEPFFIFTGIVVLLPALEEAQAPDVKWQSRNDK